MPTPAYCRRCRQPIPTEAEDRKPVPERIPEPSLCPDCRQALAWFLAGLPDLESLGPYHDPENRDTRIVHAGTDLR